MRNVLKQKITKVLEDNNNFSSYEFSIKETNMYTKIAYDLNEKDYHFNLHLPDSKKNIEFEKINAYSQKKEIIIKNAYEFSGNINPGKYNDYENFIVYSFDNVLDLLNDWLGYLSQELTSYHISKQFELRDKKIEDLKNMINDHFDQQEDSANKYLTIEEANELSKRLSELEKIIEEKITSDIKIEEKRNEELCKLHEEFDMFRNSTLSLNKKNWVKKFMISILSWSFDTNNQKKLLVGSKFLIKISQLSGVPIPEEVSSLLPENNE